MIDILILTMLFCGAAKYLFLLHKVAIRKKVAALSREFAVLNVLGYGIGFYVQLVTDGVLLGYFGGLLFLVTILMVFIFIGKHKKKKLKEADKWNY